MKKLTYEQELIISLFKVNTALLLSNRGIEEERKKKFTDFIDLLAVKVREDLK